MTNHDKEPAKPVEPKAPEPPVTPEPELPDVVCPICYLPVKRRYREQHAGWHVGIGNRR